MVSRKNSIDKFALISVYDKSKLNILCKNLKGHKYKFISTGSTFNEIRSLGYKCIEVSKITDFKEILEGRVKTLNPKIYGSILFKRDNLDHLKQFNDLKFPQIDIVIINFYPFNKFKKSTDHEKIIEMIDIGGPSLARAAGKNYKFVTTISSISEYSALIRNLNKNDGRTDLNFRKKVAANAFKACYHYDNLISDWLSTNIKYPKRINLRYGENPNQKAFIYNNFSESIFENQISGKKISYNNIVDVDSGIKCLNEFTEPTCIIIKHNNACGVASSKKIEIAFKRAFDSDKKSAFGGVVLLNRKMNNQIAKLLSKHFFEVIVATNYDDKSLKILSIKKNLILLKINKNIIGKKEFRSTMFGVLNQELDKDIINKYFLKLAGYKKISKILMADLIFSIKIAKHLKSNSIVLSSNKQTLGIGSGQTSRIDALKIAIKKYKENFKRKRFVCASDGFFPFIDCLNLLKKYNCSAVAQPYGSKNDNINIDYSNKNKIPLYFIKNRLFKH